MQFEDEYISFDIRRDSIHEDGCCDDVGSSTKRTDTEDPQTSCSNLPFQLEWIFGHNPKIPMLNLTKSGTDIVELAIGTSQVCSIYQNATKCCRFMLGHEFEINSIKCDETGRFLVTSDERCVNFWDRGESYSNDPMLVHSINSAVDDGDTIKIVASNISQNGKILVTADSGGCVKLWNWSFGKINFDCSTTINTKYGLVKSIKFNKHELERVWLILTHQYGVVFMYLDPSTNELIPYYPKYEYAQRKITDSAYIENTSNAVSVTDKGQAILWSDSSAAVIISRPASNNKEVYKVIPLRNVAINVVESVDCVVAIGDENGEIRFYDVEMKFLYWFQSIKFDPIFSISFNLTPRKYRIEDPQTYSARSEEKDVEVLFGDAAPLDATANHNVFIVRDFVVGTTTGKIGLVNYISKKCEYVLIQSEFCISHIDVHPTKPWLCASDTNGRIFIYNIDTRKCITDYKLPYQKIKENGKFVWINPTVSHLSYSENGSALYCGLDNGSILALDPIILNPVNRKTIHFTPYPIEMIKVTSNYDYLAYIDSDNCLVILGYHEEWKLIEKFRQHTQRIVGLHWMERNASEVVRLISIGKDKLLGIYEIKSASPNSSEISVKTVTIDQLATPLSTLYLSSHILAGDIPSTSKRVLLVTDDQYKFKFLDGETFENLSIRAGPVYDTPADKMKLLRGDKVEHFIVFSTRNSIGLQMLPIDGNPFKRIGMIVSANQIISVCLCSEQRFVFVLSENSHCISMWKINTRLLHQSFEKFASDPESLYKYIPGGKSGWLFKEMQDLFCYFHILSREVTVTNIRELPEFIPVTEIPDFMRGLGFFPTEFEIQNMLNEATRPLTTDDDSEAKEISFEAIVKLYMNHRPVCGNSATKLLKAFAVFDRHGRNRRRFEKSTVIEGIIDDQFVTRDELLKILTKNGEPMEETQAVLYLKELLIHEDDIISNRTSVDTIHDTLRKLPFKFNIQDFISNILGIK